MNAIRSSCRPKHQVLILKCYPRFQKNAVEVKPNSSELSYLLYYASTRRSKVQKVGAFLEKRTARDIWRGRTGPYQAILKLIATFGQRNVQVTLQILKALIEKSPRDLPLYAPYLLRILGQVLQSQDITLAEETIPTFETFCEHHDVERLSADQEYARLYEEILKNYAAFSGRESPMQMKESISTPMAIRWRNTGLRAIKSITSTESFGADGVRHLSIIMPVILQNLYSESEEYLLLLQDRTQLLEKNERETIRHRSSIATVQTVDIPQPGTGPAAAAGTTADADKLAEEEVGALALQCLKQIVSVNARGRIRMATTELLKFIAAKNDASRPQTATTTDSIRLGTWVTTLVEMVARWTPVQDRFIIVVTAMETLVSSPAVEQNLEGQLILASIISWLLSSPINLIGLSVMDILLGLIQHILLLLRLGGNGSQIYPHHQQSNSVDPFNDTKNALEPRPVTATTEKTNGTRPSQARHDLLLRLQQCVGDLATHVYYSEQISDMIQAILVRLKPSPSSPVPTATDAVENPSATAKAIADSVSMKEDADTDEFFSFATARLVALRAIKEILSTANMRGAIPGATAVGRNRVRVQVWEDTQWLLRDEKEVRMAYGDALLTWLRLETDQTDLQVMNDRPTASKSTKRDGKDQTENKLSRRAMSIGSRGDKTTKSMKLTFLQLLHLAIYDNALEAPEDEQNILLLHLLLWNLVERLGVNAVRAGLPMIFRLQEDINFDDVIPTPAAKINIGSLVHVYFWELSEKFGFEVTKVGSEIQSEVSRRKQKGLWLERVRLPPLALEQVRSLDRYSGMGRPPSTAEDESLRPFDSRRGLIEQIAMAYAKVPPPSSPPASPGRVFSLPALGFTPTPVAPAVALSPESKLPDDVKDQMLAEWTKEACIAAIERQSAKASSFTGSKTGTTTTVGHRNLLGINGTTRNNSPTGNNTPNATSRSLYGSRAPSTAHGGHGGLQKLRHASGPEASPERVSSASSKSSTVRVDELKRVLSISTRASTPLHPALDFADDTGSESEATLDCSTSDASFVQGAEAAFTSLNHTAYGPEDGQEGGKLERQGSITPKVSAIQDLSPQQAGTNTTIDNYFHQEIPPVPPLPSTFHLPGGYPSDSVNDTGNDPTPTNGTNVVRRSSSVDRNGYPANTGRPRTAPQGHNRGVGFDARARSLKRGKSRPGTRTGSKGTGGSNDWGLGLGRIDGDSHKLDLGALLKAIDAEAEAEVEIGKKKEFSIDGCGEGEEQEAGGISIPPY
ncbi:MAG: plasma membrane localization protein [Cirrosporium novae-zelandiae]|nr:MAG: plasma membrane localization protein [Cirrosporium novae-zelandiae]